MGASLRDRAGRASPLSRLRRLRLTVLIPCAALAACHTHNSRGDPTAEAPAIAYSTILNIAQFSDGGPATERAQIVLADGLLTNAEYDQVIAVWDAQRAAEYEREKAVVKSGLLQRDSRSKPDRAETGTGSVHESDGARNAQSPTPTPPNHPSNREAT